MAGLSKTAIDHLESGRTKSPNFYHALRICAALGIDLRDAARATLYENLPPNIAHLPDRVRQRLDAMKTPVAPGGAP